MLLYLQQVTTQSPVSCGCVLPALCRLCVVPQLTCEFHPSFAGSPDYTLQPHTLLYRGATGDLGENITTLWPRVIMLQFVSHLPVCVPVNVPVCPGHQVKNGNKICSPRRNTRSEISWWTGAGEGSEIGHYQD